MPDYTSGDAGRARHLVLRKIGYSENAIDTWPLDGWVDVEPNLFEYHNEGDGGNGAILCVVEFDDDFNAKVTFPDGTQGEVCLEDYAED